MKLFTLVNAGGVEARRSGRGDATSVTVYRFSAE